MPPTSSYMGTLAKEDEHPSQPLLFSCLVQTFILLWHSCRLQSNLHLPPLPPLSGSAQSIIGSGGRGADHNTMDRVQGFPIHLYRRQRLLRGKEMHGDRGEKFSRFGVEPGPFCSSDSILKQCFSKEKGFKSTVIINLVGV